MDQITKIEKKINSILEEKTGEAVRNDIAEKIREAESAIHTAEEGMKTALRLGNQNAFTEAKTALDNAVIVLEMNRSRERAIDSDPLITSDDYDEMVSQIMDTLTATCQADKAEVIALCDQIRTITARSRAALERGNKLLHTLQADVFRYADCPVVQKTGRRLVIPANEKQFKDFSLSSWTRYAIEDCVQYDAMAEGVKD